jgi:enoyl-CoA hydratase
MGLATKVVVKGSAREEAERLAEQIAAFPQACMRSDREGLYRGMGMGLPEALALEFELGLRVIASGETVDGAKRFAAGEGKHGTF